MQIDERVMKSHFKMDPIPFQFGILLHKCPFLLNLNQFFLTHTKGYTEVAGTTCREILFRVSEETIEAYCRIPQYFTSRFFMLVLITHRPFRKRHIQFRGPSGLCCSLIRMEQTGKTKKKLKVNGNGRAITASGYANMKLVVNGYSKPEHELFANVATTTQAPSSKSAPNSSSQSSEAPSLAPFVSQVS